MRQSFLIGQSGSCHHVISLVLPLFSSPYTVYNNKSIFACCSSGPCSWWPEGADVFSWSWNIRVLRTYHFIIPILQQCMRFVLFVNYTTKLLSCLLPPQTSLLTVKHF